MDGHRVSPYRHRRGFPVPPAVAAPAIPPVFALEFHPPSARELRVNEGPTDQKAKSPVYQRRQAEIPSMGPPQHYIDQTQVLLEILAESRRLGRAMESPGTKARAFQTATDEFNSVMDEYNSIMNEFNSLMARQSNDFWMDLTDFDDVSGENWAGHPFNQRMIAAFEQAFDDQTSDTAGTPPTRSHSATPTLSIPMVQSASFNKPWPPDGRIGTPASTRKGKSG